MHDDEKLTAALNALKGAPKPGTVWRHVKTGKQYLVLGGGVLEATLEPVVSYTAGGTNLIVWLMPVADFLAGFVGSDGS